MQSERIIPVSFEIQNKIISIHFDLIRKIKK